MGIGSRIRDFRKFVSMTQAELAEVFSITQAAVAAYEGEKRPLPIEMAQGIAERYDVDMNWLLTGHGEMFTCGEHPSSPTHALIDTRGNEIVGTGLLSTVPIDGIIAAGHPIANGEGPLGDVRIQLPNPGNYICLRVTGNSMSPDIQDNDLVLIRRVSDWSAGINHVTAVMIDYELTLKRLMIDARSKLFVLNSINSAFSPIIVDPLSTDIQIVGVLAYLLRTFSDLSPLVSLSSPPSLASDE